VSDCSFFSSCQGNEDTFTFLENILKEVLELFPSEFIHIGGDEVHIPYWATHAEIGPNSTSKIKYFEEQSTIIIRFHD